MDQIIHTNLNLIEQRNHDAETRFFHQRFKPLLQSVPQISFSKQLRNQQLSAIRVLENQAEFLKIQEDKFLEDRSEKQQTGKNGLAIFAIFLAACVSFTILCQIQ